MKKRQKFFAALMIMVVFAVQPIGSMAASTDSVSLAVTDVECTVDPVFEFTLPPNTTILYPNTSVLVGQFGVSDLLLRSGEQLSIELLPGVMAARGTGGTLPYTVSFNPPAVVDSANIGQTYDVLVSVDTVAFAATRRPFYDATLLFQVRSSLTDEVIWQGTTTVTARKTPVTGGGGAGNGPAAAEGNGPAVNPDGGQAAQPGEPITEEAIPEASGSEANLADEGIPTAPLGTVFPWWWLVLGLGLIIFILWLIFFIKRRRKKEEEMDE